LRAGSSLIILLPKKLRNRGVARVIPCPFGYATNPYLEQKNNGASREKIRVPIELPPRFVGIASDAPCFLEECVAAALAEMSLIDRDIERKKERKI